RRNLEARGQIDHVETRIDTKGRKQPAKRAPTKPQAVPADVQATRFTQALPKRCHTIGVGLRRAGTEETDHRHSRLLRACRERPRCRAAEQSDELAPCHSITSSASAISLSGTSRPSARAVLRLITSSNLVGCSTGRSPGFSPLTMRLA